MSLPSSSFASPFVFVENCSVDTPAWESIVGKMSIMLVACFKRQPPSQFSRGNEITAGTRIPPNGNGLIQNDK